ncbi:hypothetical protein UlMin_007990 [Ulmus minor]
MCQLLFVSEGTVWIFLKDDNGTWLGDRDQIGKAFENKLKEVYTRGNFCCLENLEGLVGGELSSDQLSLLSSTPSEEEILRAFREMDPNKTANPTRVNDFRPISLCNVSYKIITKVIANQLKPLLPFLISPNQTALVKGRNIVENTMVIQVVVHSMKRKKGNSEHMLLKFDMEKAYDKLEWGFIQVVLKDFGFPNRLITNFLGLHHMHECSKYLVIPLFFSKSQVKDLDFVVHKIQNKVASWKSKLLSKAGRLKLIKTVGSTLPFYAMMTTPFPKSVCQKIDYTLMKFWWSSNGNNDRTLCLKAWESFCKPKSWGGVGLYGILIGLFWPNGGGCCLLKVRVYGALSGVST